MRRFIERRKPFAQLYLMLILPLAYLFTFRYAPMVGVQIAFKQFDIMKGMWGSPWSGFYQFQKFLTDYNFQRVLKNTFILALYGIVANFPFPIIFALALNAVRRKRFKKFVQTVTYMPHFISTVVVVGMMMQFFNPITGTVSQIIKFVTGKQINDMFGSPNAFPHLYVLSGVWQGFGYGSIIYLAALTSVNPELYEAAEIDGANRMQRMLHIDIPCILPTVTIMLILNAGNIMSIGFEKAYLMQNSLNLRASEVISTYSYKKGLASGSANDYSYSSAVGLLNAVVNMILIVFVNTVSRRVGETSLW